MAGNYWRSLFRGIWAVPDGYDPVSPPSEADLEQFEADFGIRLPESYRTFVLQFGAGETRSGVYDFCSKVPSEF